MPRTTFLAELRSRIVRLPLVEPYAVGRRLLRDPTFRKGVAASEEAKASKPSRTDIINFLLATFSRSTEYLEIGVRNPNDNFEHIRAGRKWSVDPGHEFAANPVDFPLTSDEFFTALRLGKLQGLDPAVRFDVIFVDGLHLAEQVDRDIANGLDFLADDGFMVLHDCNPPTEWHARETYAFALSPAAGNWNGTTWKAFLKARARPDLQSCCVDCDWGVGILSKCRPLGAHADVPNPFFEFGTFAANRRKVLNLVDFDSLRRALETARN